MFSALKWVTAAVVVALFGTVVLLGVLPSAQDDMAPGAPRTTEQLLAASETEEVEPGVLRIIDDGVRNLANVSDGVTVSSDGAVWLHRADGAYFQVGEEPSGDLMSYADRDGWQVDDTWGERSFGADSLHAGPSGQLWVQVEDGVRTWRDGD